MLLTHRQTNKQTKTGKNITSLAEVIISIYAQSVPSIDGHNGLDATPLADSGIKG